MIHIVAKQHSCDLPTTLSKEYMGVAEKKAHRLITAAAANLSCAFELEVFIPPLPLFLPGLKRI